MTTPVIVNIADLVDPDDPHSRSYRQVNAARTHVFPIGSLVELKTGARLFVVFHGRDCDMTPLYYLSADRDDTGQQDPRFRNSSWRGGYAEDSLRIVKPSTEEEPTL
jgi:hypothetical protein